MRDAESGPEEFFLGDEKVVQEAGDDFGPDRRAPGFALLVEGFGA